VTEPVVVPVGDAALRADLTVPDAARGVVLFAHGSGSGRLSPRNRQVAADLHRRGLATLLLDLLTSGRNGTTGATGGCASTSSCWPTG
jgi:putative phosphoribosyl transferase